LNGIERLANLERIELIGLPITDLSPLLHIPHLHTLIIDRTLLEAADAIRSRAGFEIVVW
jgi:hypothetical protein